jgi:glutamate--cysteine ligase
MPSTRLEDGGVVPADTTSAQVADDLPISETDAEAMIKAICFKTGPPAMIGAELEWLVRDATNPSLSVPYPRIRDVLDDLEQPGVLPGAGLLTLEPGGQVELSTAPAKDLSDCVAVARGDLAVLHKAFGNAGLLLSGHGIDPIRKPSRVLDLPRYAAMEEYFDRDSIWGRLMMCSTASVQVCVDAGLDDDSTLGLPFRWRLLHALGPVLVAMFANSPLRRGLPTGWKCTRQLVWSRLDPGRTQAPPGAEPARGFPSASGQDVRDRWTGYALDAGVLCMRRSGDGPWPVPDGLTFREWLRAPKMPRQYGPVSGRPEADGAAQAPSADDLSYHLSTLFPPVRPRGHLELRMIDAQPGDDWIVPVAVVAALADDASAAAAAMAAAEQVWRWPGQTVPSARNGNGAGPGDPWLRAASCGLADPALARAARSCFAEAEAALDRSGAPADIRQVVSWFGDRYVRRARCPADDILDAIAN